MFRGEQLLMALAGDEIISASKKHVKGIYTDRRDHFLCCRFYYYATIQQRNYEFCLRELSNEFFLTELVIAQRLMARREIIKDLKQKNTTVRDLRKEFAHFVWE